MPKRPRKTAAATTPDLPTTISPEVRLHVMEALVKTLNVALPNASITLLVADVIEGRVTDVAYTSNTKHEDLPEILGKFLESNFGAKIEA